MTEIDERYKRGKIYTIRCRYDDSLIYVGSTIESLSKRMGGHRSDSVRRPNKYFYKCVNNEWDKWYIELYENFPCDCKEELLKREGEVIRLIANLNCNIAGRDKKGYYEDNKDKYAQINKKRYEEKHEIILQQKKEYFKNNRELVLEQKKKHRENNLEKYAEKDKLYYKNNIEKIKAYREQKCICDLCGAEITKVYLKKHQKTNKCISVNK